MLLDEDPEAPEAVMHEPARRWGKGFLITDRGGHRFDAPAEQTLDGRTASTWFTGGAGSS